MARHIVLVLSYCISSSQVLAGAILDLRPSPSIPELGYDLGQIIQVDVYLLDNANTQNVSFTQVSLNSSATDSHLTEGPAFNWINPGGIGNVFSTLPAISWTYPLATPIPALQITLPDGGEVKLGDFDLNVGTTSGIFELNLLSGAQLNHAGGLWTDANGQITGGIVQIPVAIPEPGTVLLLAGFLPYLLRRRFLTHC